jgi:hypothetical protein
MYRVVTPGNKIGSSKIGFRDRFLAVTQGKNLSLTPVSLTSVLPKGEEQKMNS